MNWNPQDKQMANEALSYSQINNFLTLLPPFSLKVSPQAPIGGVLLTTSRPALPNSN